MEIAASTEIGLRQRHPTDAHIEECIAPNVTLLAIADGFGAIGRVPTAQCALALLRDFLRRRHRLGAYGRNVSPASLRAILLAALEHANVRLYEAGGSHEDRVGSGTSLTAVLVVGEHALVGHVGDARAYLMRGRSLEMLTVDDAMVVDAAVATSTRIASRPRVRGVLWRTLGTQAKLEASVAHVDVRPGDQLVLCTDGVHRLLDDDELGDALVRADQCADAVAHVLATTRARGSLDSGTLVVCRDLLGAAPVALGGAPRAGIRALVALGLLVAALLSFGSYAFHGGPFDRSSSIGNATPNRP